MFPANPNLDNDIEVRQRERFIVNFARTKAYQKSAIPYCQNLLNTHFSQLQEEGGAGPGEEEEGKEEEEEEEEEEGRRGEGRR